MSGCPFPFIAYQQILIFLTSSSLFHGYSTTIKFSKMNVKFLAFLLNLLFLLPSFSISAQHLLKLTRVDLLEQLGLNNENTSVGASEDGRLDTLLAFGTSLYTGRLEIGTPPQGSDFLLNFAGNLPFPSHGDFSFVASSACDHLSPCQCKDTFNASASTSFQSKSDVGFHTKLSSGNGVRLPIQLFGRYAEEQISFAKALNFQEPWLGQVEMVQGSLFNRLPFDGMISLGRRSSLVARVDSLHLQLHSDYGYLLLNGKLGTGCGQWSQWSELGDKPFARPNSDAFQFTLTQVSLRAPKSVYKDDDKRQALLNPNSPFLQGPAKSVQTMARQINAVKQRLGSQELYTISCAEDYGPMQFTVGDETIMLNIPKEKLNMALPSAAALLPRGRCLWAIQELPAPDHAADYWILGRPVFEQYCISLDVISKTIGFASINDE